MREYGFTVTEHDPRRPWIVRGSEHHTVTLEDGENFFAWASQRWPGPSWSVELDPWQLSPGVAEVRFLMLLPAGSSSRARGPLVIFRGRAAAIRYAVG
ncbi:MAG TPA: hypothetical protein VGN29_11975 [Solirubrobacteraceae bacterium]|nr:hypothetical protein [Solirubrobacteraceae bacterium]